MASSRGFLSGVTVGASLVYFLDAERGPDRRDRFQRRVAPLIAEARRSLGMESVEKDVAPEMLRFGARVGDIQGLGAATLESPGGFGHTETVLRVAGALLALYGLVRRGSVGALIRTLGAGMLVGSARDSLSGIGLPTLERRRAVDIQKTLYIDAPIEQVYGFWSNYENFPLFMSHVREVARSG